MAANLCTTPSRGNGRGVRRTGRIGRGIRLKSQTKTIVGNVYDYFNSYYKTGRGSEPFKRTADATKLGIRTINKLIKERNKLQQLDDEGQSRQNIEQGQPRQDIGEEQSQDREQNIIEEEMIVIEGTNEETDRQNTHLVTNNVNFDSPLQRYRHSRRTVTTDSFDIEVIRRTIYGFNERKEHLTLTKLLDTLRKEGIFKGQRTLLQRLMREMGFKYKRVDDRRYYYEQPHIIDQRRNYLCKMMQNRADNKPVVFLDETWANAHDGKDLAWVEDDTVTGGTLGGRRRPSGKGKRLIILGAGGEMGWIPNTTLIFQSKKDTGDYHDEMTGEHFEEWFRDSLLPNVSPHSLIVMDNASYHSRIEEEMPKKSWTKSKMITWLAYYGVEFFDDDCTKPQLFSIIQDATRRMGLKKQYIIDKMALDAGHEVVRLPVAHCTLNPIELAWAQVKGHIKANTCQYTLNEVERLAWEGFEVVTQERWAGLVKHVRDKVEDHYWQNDRLDVHTRLSVSEFVIHVGGESSDESDDSTSEIDATQNSNSALNDFVVATDTDDDI